MTDKPTPPEGYEVMLGKNLPSPHHKWTKVWRRYTPEQLAAWAGAVKGDDWQPLGEDGISWPDEWYAVPVQKLANSNRCPKCGENTLYLSGTSLRCSLGSCLWPEDQQPVDLRRTSLNATAPDPKKIMGDQKSQLQLIPPALNVALAAALQNGIDKGYGPFNWREKPVEVMTYLGAMKRHIDDFLDGEDVASDSKVHHMGHIAANCAILLDAAKHGTLVDNRPLKKQTV